MSRTYMAPTKRKSMSKARAARIFRSRNGICFLCSVQISLASKWSIEHPDTVDGGGSDDDKDLWPIHDRCKLVKDAVDAKEKGRRDRLVTAGWTGKAKGRPMPGSRNSPWKRLMNGTVERRNG